MHAALRRTSARSIADVRLALLLALGVLGVLSVAAYWQFTPVTIEYRSSVIPIPFERHVIQADDAGKPGTTRGVMGQLRFNQEARTTGPSPDVLEVRFDQPARILGVDVSVDIVGLPLVEVAVGIDPDATYGLGARDWLIHTSDQNGGQPTRSMRVSGTAKRGSSCSWESRSAWSRGF